MSNPGEFLWLSNGTSVPWAAVSEWPAPEFVAATAAELARGGRLCAWFGVPENSGTRLVAVLAFDADNTLAVGRSAPVTKGYPALTLRSRRRTCSSAKSGNSTACCPRDIRG